ncbi:hypothetical protein K437DRAFT_228968 [Tilletiaria anomala UBC 951]|uniref:Uncharacterized protein n=1 Tax=Tilletiaria anomala (strain ATCC 24038 / CBS 436.72 / UBC 951) TaxID=1037660 RepID=A0A066V868_TILAU|nr:uncharacterized protein K437DRAFT_228968 [Tilletiaria anomala UBC 951]KDN37907.1 hypothetical protein K437DRAFT_228968 [Tilletiaria anomala UBC 951]
MRQRATLAAASQAASSHRASACSSSSATASRKPLPRKILIANRGEITVRIIRTCRQLGIATVAVYSEADANAMHVKMADEAYCIGPAPSAESYLKMDRIVEVAKMTGAEMIHPGYGFLSEAAEFADLLAASGIEFIGPPSAAIRAMGSKSASKEIMLAAGVPCVPGYHGAGQSLELLQAEADKIGYPVLIKAVKGGGGKGMKIATSAQEFREQLESAQREGAKSFGDPTVLLERYLTKPRHVEVQVMCDKFGNAIYVWERDCSVQRRHQKIIEEAPAPGLSEELRRDLGEKAVAAAKAVDYVGAGTVEFLLDAETMGFHFCEMNTRLQVEHPISEMISGLDLVQLQLEIAAGNPLTLTQADVQRNGHAFEARIYAENTRANFLPDVGLLRHVRLPPTSETVRVDTGFGSGDEISVHYDPMIAKLIVHGADRKDALRRLSRALEQYEVVGPKTNIEFLKNLASHHAFIDGKVETAFIGKYGHELQPPIPPPSATALANAALYLALRDAHAVAATAAGASVWTRLSGFRNTPSQLASRVFEFRATAAGTEGAKEEAPVKSIVTLEPVALSGDRFNLVVEHGAQGKEKQVYTNVHARLSSPSPTLAGAVEDHTPAFALTRRSTTTVISRKPTRAEAATSGRSSEKLDIFVDGVQVELEVAGPAWLDEVLGRKESAKGSVICPMPSKVVDVRVRVGQEVEEGDVVIVLEAMKTEHVLRAPKSGKVAKVAVSSPGELVAEGVELVQFEETDDSA